MAATLLDIEKIDFKLECGARRNDVAHALLPVGQSGRDDQLPGLADAHVDNPVVPSLKTKQKYEL